MRPAIHTGLIGAVLGYLLGHWLGNFLASGYQQLTLSDSNDMPIVLGYALGVVGWLAGLRRVQRPFPQDGGTSGEPPSLPDRGG